MAKNSSATTNTNTKSRPSIDSQEIASIKLLNPLPLLLRTYVFPFLILYPLAGWVYFVKYDEILADQSNTFFLCVGLFGSHALAWLATKWSVAFRALTTAYPASSVESARVIKVVPFTHRGSSEFVELEKTMLQTGEVLIWFNYQRDKYTYSRNTNTFSRLFYPYDNFPTLSKLQSSVGLTTMNQIEQAVQNYGANKFDIPVPRFAELFAEHAVAPFFVFQLFCVGLWCLDEYWYYSLFTLFMLVVFECTVVFQRLKTLEEFRTMSIKPYGINVYREKTWKVIQSDELLPGDLVSVTRTKEDSGTPCDLVLLHGSCIVNEAMLSGESTPLLKEAINLKPGTDHLDIQGSDRNSVLFGGTKVLQSTSPSDNVMTHAGISDTPPDGGCLALVIRTGFGTAQGQLVRTMIFSTERVTANNLESFLFIAFLLIFAIAASAYVWIKGLEHERKRTKLLLDCVIIITSVVPPELPMELSMAVNSSLIALSKFAIFCTEPFRIPLAGRVDVCCFDKTGTITGEDLVVEGVAGTDVNDLKALKPLTEVEYNTVITLASAHALVLLEEGVVGDPMEKITLEAMDWKLSNGDLVSPNSNSNGEKKESSGSTIAVRRRFQFSSALKRMSTVSSVVLPGTPKDSKKKRTVASVKGAPETLKGMYEVVPEGYESTYKWYAQKGCRVLALGTKELPEVSTTEQINKLEREYVESKLSFMGFLVFNCPLKPDAIKTIQNLNDSTHRNIMITGDNPLTAAHVARQVEIVDREVFILDMADGVQKDDGLAWRTVDESQIIPVNPKDRLDRNILENYDICITGAALKQYEDREEEWNALIRSTWVYARVSPVQKESILTTFKELGYVTLMAGDGTNDVGALKQAHVGIALLEGTKEDLQKIGQHAQVERAKKLFEQQLKLTQRFKQPPPPVPKILAPMYPDLVEAQKKATETHQAARQGSRPSPKFDQLESLTTKLSEMGDEEAPPTIKLGDASVAAPFTSKLSNVVAVENIIRQGRCTLVATLQMYKILALNSLISAYSLSVMYLDGIKFGDYQITITGMLTSVCFLCISRAKPVEKLSKERPLNNIFNFYVLLSVLLQFAIHIASLLYVSALSESLEQREEQVDLEAEFKPGLLNSAVYLLSLSQQVSTFAVNFQGRPFREGISENPALYYGLLAATAVAYSGATDFVPELNRWLQVVDMSFMFRFKLVMAMLLDFGLAWVVEIVMKYLFANVKPKDLVAKGMERRDDRRIKRDAEEAEMKRIAKETAKVEVEDSTEEKKEK